METDKGTQNANMQADSSSSERKCIVDGKMFKVIRHFTGDKPLSDIMTKLAIGRANREMGL